MEVDPAALPALTELCAALGIRTHWQQSDQTLYIESPANGKELVIGADHASNSAWQEVTDQTLRLVKQRLDAAGARVTVGDPTQADPGSLVIRLSLGNHSAEGVFGNYHWIRWNQDRTLAGMLASAVAAHIRLPDLGARSAMGGARPSVDICVGGLDRHADTSDHSVALKLAEGICEGLMRYWAESLPVPAAQAERSAIAPAEPVPTKAKGVKPETALPPREPATADDDNGEEELRLTLYPDPALSAPKAPPLAPLQPTQPQAQPQAPPHRPAAVDPPATPAPVASPTLPATEQPKLTPAVPRPTLATYAARPKPRLLQTRLLTRLDPRTVPGPLLHYWQGRPALATGADMAAVGPVPISESVDQASLKATPFALDQTEPPEPQPIAAQHLAPVRQPSERTIQRPARVIQQHGAVIRGPR